MIYCGLNKIKIPFDEKYKIVILIFLLSGLSPEDHWLWPWP